MKRNKQLTLVGSTENVVFKRTADGLQVELPKDLVRPNDISFVLAIN